MKERDIQVLVFSREKVAEFVTDLPYLHISIRDHKSSIVETPDNPNLVARLNLEFSDFDVSRCPRTANVPGLKVFTEDDARSILQVVNLTEKYISLIAINCEAGVSRSAAVAAAITRLLGQDESVYFAPKGPYIPNRYIYRTILNVGMDTRPLGA